MQSNERRNAPMKTYSRRASTKVEEPSRTKRASEEVAELEVPSQVKKISRSSIRSYFEPIRPSSSSAPPTPGLSNSSDAFELPSPSPAELFSRSESPERPKEPHRGRRRLQTKPTLAPVLKVSTCSIKGDAEGLQELVGPLKDGSRSTYTSEIAAPATVNRNSPVMLSSENAHGDPIVQVYPYSCHTSSDRFHTPQGFSNVSSETVEISNKTKKKLNKRNLQQSILDLSLDRFRECKDCGMLFNVTDKRERTIHDKFHHDAVQGKQPKKNKSEAGHLDKYIDGVQYQLRVLTRTTSVEWRNFFMKALDNSYKDLGGLQIDESSLWSDIKNPHDLQDPNQVPRYKIYAFFVELIPVAILLTERIERGGVHYHGPVTHDQFGPSTSQPGEPGVETQEYVSRDVSYPVYMSVDRIWTHKDHRRKGLATVLVDNARDTFIQGMVIPKKRIAFSLPTSLGTTFAENYCKGVFQDAKFLVNLEDANYVVDGGKLCQRPRRKVQ